MTYSEIHANVTYSEKVHAKKIHANVPRFQCEREVDNHSRLHVYIDGANEQGGKNQRQICKRGMESLFINQ